MNAQTSNHCAVNRVISTIKSHKKEILKAKKKVLPHLLDIVPCGDEFFRILSDAAAQGPPLFLDYYSPELATMSLSVGPNPEAKVEKMPPLKKKDSSNDNYLFEDDCFAVLFGEMIAANDSVASSLESLRFLVNCQSVEHSPEDAEIEAIPKEEKSKKSKKFNNFFMKSLKKAFSLEVKVASDRRTLYLSFCLFDRMCKI